MKGKKRHNTRLIRRNRSYSIQEVSKLLGVHPNAVRRWIKAGLSPLDGNRPILIHGAALAAFLDQRRNAAKTRLQFDEFFCFPCRAARKAAGSLADIRPHAHKTVKLHVLCDVCQTAMSKIGKIENLEKYRQVFESSTLGQQHLSDQRTPSVECYLEGSPQNATVQ